MQDVGFSVIGICVILLMCSLQPTTTTKGATVTATNPAAATVTTTDPAAATATSGPPAPPASVVQLDSALVHPVWCWLRGLCCEY